MPPAGVSGAVNQRQTVRALRHARQVTLAGAIAILAAAGLLRMYASLGDLWLDEIWSLNIASQIRSAGQVLTSVHQENNHYLNTWLMWLIGPHAPVIWYRLPAVAAGVVTVALAGLIAKGSRAESWIAMILTGTGYLLVHYSSEARGYAYVLMFAAAGFWSLDQSFRRRMAFHEWLFALACALGALSQPMFVYFFAAAGIWAIWRWRGLGPSAMAWAGHLARTLLLPAGVLAVLWVVDLDRTQNAGGPIFPLVDVMIETASRTVGGVASGSTAVWSAILAAVAFASALVTGRQSVDARWLFYLLVSVVAPGALVAGLGRDDVYVRYLLIAAFFVLIAFSSLLARLFDQGGARRWLAVAAIAAMLAGNAAQLEPFLRDGRGRYVAALTLMNDSTAGPEIVAGGDHDFQNAMIIDFYRSRIPGLKPLRYLDQTHWPPGGPEWLIRLDYSEHFDAPPRIGMPGQPYHLIEVFPYSGLSGLTWAVYHRGD